MCLMQHCHCRYIVITCTVSVALVAFFGGCIAHLLCFYVWLGTIILYYVCMYVCISGVLLKMEVGIRKRARQRDWRYPAYLWSLRWVYAVKKTPRRLVYAVYPRIPPNTPLVCMSAYVLLIRKCSFVSVLAHQLDKNLQGRLTWTAGVHSSMNATLVWDREQHHVVTSIQVSVHSVVSWLLCLLWVPWCCTLTSCWLQYWVKGHYQ